MEKVSFIILISLRKTIMIVFFSIMLLSLSSCATFINALLGDTECAHPGCTRNASGRTAYCHFHVPPTLNENEPVKIDSNNAYKLHKPLSEEEMKTKVKINRRNY